MLPHLRDFNRKLKLMTKLLKPIAGEAKEQVSGNFKSLLERLKRINIKKIVDSASTKAVFTAAGGMLAIMSVMLFYGLGFRFGYHVYVGDKFLASVPDKSALSESLQRVDDTLGYEYSYKNEPVAKLAIVRFPSEDITDDILSTLSDVTEGLVLTVDGKEIAKFRNSAEATEALSRVLKATRAEGAESAEFADNLEFSKTYIKTAGIQNLDSVVDYLVSYKTSPDTYTLKEGETIDTVSAKHKIAHSDLLDRNPSYTEEDFKEGTEIVLNCPKRVLPVKSIFAERVVEEIPFETEQIEAPELYTGVTSVKKAGKTGSKEVSKKTMEIDGVRVAIAVEEEVVLEKPEVQIEYIGTREPAEGTVTGNFERPLSGGVVTSRYGARWGTVHNGVDIGAPEGTPIRSADGGIVLFAGDDGDGYGLKVIVDHGNNYITLYAHCSRLLVSTGIAVEKGDLIAEVGNTGYSTGPHLHFEVQINGSAVNPMPFIDGTASIIKEFGAIE